jgi:hypothetical protein
MAHNDGLPPSPPRQHPPELLQPLRGERLELLLVLPVALEPRLDLPPEVGELGEVVGKVKRGARRRPRGPPPALPPRDSRRAGPGPAATGPAQRTPGRGARPPPAPSHER